MTWTAHLNTMSGQCGRDHLKHCLCVFHVFPGLNTNNATTVNCDLHPRVRRRAVAVRLTLIMSAAKCATVSRRRKYAWLDIHELKLTTWFRNYIPVLTFRRFAVGGRINIHWNVTWNLFLHFRSLRMRSSFGYQKANTIN